MTSSKTSYKRLLGYLKGLWPFFFLSITGFFIYAATNAWFVELFGNLVDNIEESTRDRLYFPLLLVLIVMTRGFGGFLGAYFMAYIANNVIHRLRCQLMDKFLLLPTTYYDKNNSGHLLSTVTYNTTQVNYAVSDSLAVLFREGATVLALFIYLLYSNWKLALIFFSVTPLISLVVLYASKKFRKHSSRIQISMGDVTQIISETLKGMKVVKAFGGVKNTSKKLLDASELNRNQNMKLIKTLSISTPVIQLLVASALAFLIWLAMSPDILETTSAGDFVAFIMAAGLMLKPIRQLSQINAPIQKGLAAADSIFQILDEEQEQDSGAHTTDEVRGKVDFIDVSFKYRTSTENVLTNISFNCKAGETIAIVGKSGSGKSTLVNLLPRFYELTEGKIQIDDISHTDYQLANLRQHLALVSQQIVLFNGSIRDNIAYGELSDISESAIHDALSNANALEFIEQLPEGIDTLVGDDGVMLSGGQRQRLAIARALLKNAPILILDEATSALDTESERTIQSALEKLMSGRTTFVIAHRLSTVENADKILVMSKGKIVEQGKHSELLGKQGFYAKLHQSNFQDD